MEQYAWTAERMVSRSSRVSGTDLNAAVFSFGGFVGAFHVRVECEGCRHEIVPSRGGGSGGQWAGE